MKPRRFTLTGRTSKTGKLMLSNQGDMNEFLANHPSKSFLMEIVLNETETSEALSCYYERSVVPDFQHAFKEIDGERFTLQETDLKLRKMSTVMHEEIPDEEKGGFELVRLASIRKVGNHRAAEFLEDLRLIGSTKYGLVVRDPITI